MAIGPAYDSHLAWRTHGVLEFDARKMVSLNEEGEEIAGYSRGKG